jgi:hypothetical protein
MHWMIETGRFLVIAGGIIILVGFVLLMSDKIPLGRLPGDLRIGSGPIRVYIPIVTCILLSLAITILLNLFSRK